MTGLPAPRARVALPQIAPVSWEHQADRAALQAMRSVPGFDEVVRKVIAILGGAEGMVREKIAPAWPLLLLAVLAFFLLLQAVPFLAKKSKQREGEPPQ